MNWPFEDLAYLEKSGILQANVHQVPVTADILERKRYDLVLPVTVARAANISPVPPALCMHQPIVPSAVIGVTMSFIIKSQRSLVGGMSSNGS